MTLDPQRVPGPVVETPQDGHPASAHRDRAALLAAHEVVIQVAFEWAGEYGFSQPERAREVWAAAALLRPDLEPKA